MEANKNRKRRSGLNEIVFEHGKIPPQALDLEEAVLGAMMLEPDRMEEVVEVLKPEAFYKEAHQIIFSAISRLYSKNNPVDILTVTEELRSSGELDLSGGPYFITMLTNRIASTANIEYHSKIILQKYLQREVIRVGSEAIRLAYEDMSDFSECIDVLENGVNAINLIGSSGGDMKSVEVLANEVETLARHREKQFKEGKCTGVQTGLSELNRRTAGWQKGNLIVLAGRPSMGKTALMLHHAINAKVPVCIYSLEMSSVSLANRLILSMADIDVDRFRSGAMNQQDWDEFYQAKSKLSKLPIYVDDKAVVTTRYIKSHSKMMKSRGKCEMIFVDYLQLADMRLEQSGRNREQEVAQTAREFKIMAKTLDIPVMLLSQLSRMCEARADKKPLLSDLRESGAIEQDADIVMFAYRPAYYGLTGKNGRDMTGVGFEIIAKGRDIGVGEVMFKHNESMTKIYDFDNESYQPLPPIKPNERFGKPKIKDDEEETIVPF